MKNAKQNETHRNGFLGSVLVLAVSAVTLGACGDMQGLGSTAPAWVHETGEAEATTPLFGEPSKFRCEPGRELLCADTTLYIPTEPRSTASFAYDESPVQNTLTPSSGVVFSDSGGINGSAGYNLGEVEDKNVLTPLDHAPYQTTESFTAGAWVRLDGPGTLFSARGQRMRDHPEQHCAESELFRVFVQHDYVGYGSEEPGAGGSPRGRDWGVVVYTVPNPRQDIRFTDGEWHHIVVTRHSAYIPRDTPDVESAVIDHFYFIRFYVDGEEHELVGWGNAFGGGGGPGIGLEDRKVNGYNNQLCKDYEQSSGPSRELFHQEMAVGNYAKTQAVGTRLNGLLDESFFIPRVLDAEEIKDTYCSYGLNPTLCDAR